MTFPTWSIVAVNTWRNIMILFVVPPAATLTNRPPRRPDAFAHLSTWQLIVGEMAHGFRRLWTTRA